MKKLVEAKPFEVGECEENAPPREPRATSAKPQALGAGATSDGHDGAQPEYLIVEDHEGFGRTLKKTLERWGNVTWVRRFDEAVAAFRRRPFSALFVDVRLPGRSGFEVLEAFREANARTPAMVLTGYFDGRDSVRACELGAQYVAKPITTQGLHTFVVTARRARPLRCPPTGLALTPAEQRVYRLLVRRLSNREIASTLFVSVETVRTHVHRILAKAGVHSRSQVRPRSDAMDAMSKITLFG